MAIDLRSDPRGMALRAIRERLAGWEGPPVDLIAARAILYGNAPELPDWIADGPLGPPTDAELAGRSIIEDLGIRPIFRGRPPYPMGRREFERLAIVGPTPDAWPTLRRTLDHLARMLRPEAPPPRGFAPLAGWLSVLTDRACSRRPEFSALDTRTFDMPLEWKGSMDAEFVRLTIVPDLADASGRLLDALAPEPIAPEPPEAAPQRTGGTSEANPFPKLSPPGKALAAAYDLKREGCPVSVYAAAKRAGVDRKHLNNRYPEAVRLIKALGTPDGRVPRGSKDRRTGTIEAVDDYAVDDDEG